MADSRISYSVIWTLPFFSGQSDREKMELLKVTSFRRVQHREMLFLQGDPMPQLYWVCSGAVQIFRETPDGREITAGLRAVGDVIFDSDAAGLSFTHVMNARAVKDTTLLAVPASWMEQNMKSFGHFVDKFVTLLAQRVQETQIEVEHQSTMNAAQIIVCFLQHLCVQHHFDLRGFDLPYTKSLIASRMGMTLENFSRTLPHLKAFGITVQGKRVSFDDVDAAQRHSCDVCSVIEECPARRAMRQQAQADFPVRRKELAG